MSANGSTTPELAILHEQYSTQAERDAVTRAYYVQASGDPETDPVQFAVLVDANARLLKSYPDQLKKVMQIETRALVKSLDKLPTSKQVSELANGLTEMRDVYRHFQSAAGIAHDSFLVTWGIRLAIAAVAFIIGALLGQVNGVRQEDARVDRIVNALPTALRVPTTLWAHGGDISIGSMPDNDTGRETYGLIIRPGTLRFGEARTTTAGAAFIPIPAAR